MKKMNEQKIEQKQKMMDVILKWKKDFNENDKIHVCIDHTVNILNEQIEKLKMDSKK
jgi:hypothetical protein